MIAGYYIYNKEPLPIQAIESNNSYRAILIVDDRVHLILENRLIKDRKRTYIYKD